MYLSREVIVSNKNFSDCFSLFDLWSREAREIENQAIFVMRQNFFSFGKEEKKLNKHEKVVFDWVQNVLGVTSEVKPKVCMSNNFLKKLFRINQLFCNVDIYSKVKQNQINKAQKDFSNFFKSLKAYKKQSEKFLGRPKFPKYHKTDRATLYFDNQCFNVVGDEVEFIRAHKSNIRLKIGDIDGNVKEIKVVPFYDRFKVCIIYEIDDVEINEKRKNIAGIDFGLDNLAAIVSNVEGMTPILYKGGYVKAINQKFNKDRAKFVSLSDKTGDDMSEVLDRISRNRRNRIKSQFHKISSDIVKELKKYNIDCLVLGWNDNIKQEINIGHVNNQNFVICPLKNFAEMIAYKAKRSGIEVIFNEESYTSRASFLNFDNIPVYDGCHHAYKFSGRRIKRGLYKTKDGRIINADVNGACNIVRKVFKQAFDNISDFSQFFEVNVKRFYDLNNSKSNLAVDRGCVTSQ